VPAEAHENAAALEKPSAPVKDREATIPAVASVLRCGVKLFGGRRVAPPPKMQHFLDWITTEELIGEDELPMVEQLLTMITSGVESQADSMTAVLAIKAASSRDELREAFAAVTKRHEAVAVGDASDDDGPKSAGRVQLTVTSPDVLSALGVAGSTLRTGLKANPAADGEELCVDIHRALVASGINPLPRRAQRFVDDENRHLRQLDPKRPRLVKEDAEPTEEAEAVEQQKRPQPKPSQR
jgi:hypothetical protein